MASREGVSVSLLILLMFVSTFLFAPQYMPIKDAKALPEGTVLKVVPSNLTVGTDPFTIAVKIYNVTNLFGWQVRFRFDEKILNTTRDQISFPPDHVFNYTTYMKLGPYITIKGSEISPGQYANYTYIDIGATLYGAPTPPAFNGTGTLFSVRFKGIAGGTTMLEFIVKMTKPKDNTGQTIPFTFENGQVLVITAKAGSAISISLYPTTVTPGANVTISGAINVTRPNVDVTIKYRPTTGTFDTLAVVKANLTSGYSYNWNTTGVAAGTYEIKASWAGDPLTNGAESEIKAVTVGEKPPQPVDYMLYIVVAIVGVGIIAALVLYFLKLRKPKSV